MEKGARNMKYRSADILFGIYDYFLQDKWGRGGSYFHCFFYRYICVHNIDTLTNILLFADV